MTTAYIVEAVRTPVGKRGGSLAGIHSADLAAHSLRALVERAGIDPGAVDDVILGCTDTLGSQAGNIARTAWLVAGFPEHVPGVTIDRQCGSSQQAVHFAAQAVMSGTNDLVIAGGVQNMSAIPISAAMVAGAEYGFTTPFAESPGWLARYGDQEISQFRAAEMIAARWGIGREQMEQFALESHRRAAAAADEGRFAREIAPIAGLAADEGPRRDTSLERMAGLPVLVEGGRITAAVASQLSDASSAVLVASERAVQAHGLTPRARVHHLSVRGADPAWMLTAPIPATAHALDKAGMTVDDIDLFEVNEAFASVVLAWMQETGVERERVNVNGGGIALGHPIGATGTRLMTTMLHELERTGGRYGLQTMCEGGGVANVTIIERL
ncbi:acetyl-CoA C-acetyltransferase [Microbacterium sp. zg.Y1090]|uniref:acetyl-CoA C-acetyltransferase n=1 Tax=Microbacterium TaxID=33882 RepID=UPI00214C1026|nr:MULTISPECIES: acetyl-CoA C-acetyltransferase [unclassified Microbacterium]MCR2813334.1 acetyl-CoA C-acetyltransferase [Microbacterium sp. zg.Y1084]MCR2819832.1 acetyl-CoA C-acetyltransferase [Microbacterium sp. zg.Y1090]MDL5487943.1 acetyl-CoA C-acetyltransferase [Microbacterium sp. zg-Y1211]WIM28611.1 acetyl-CoA C-acetyltransferase [Microbacterium sp. zg-Y1090]